MTFTEKVLYYVLAFIAVIFRLELTVETDELKELDERILWQRQLKQILEDNLSDIDA